MKGKIKARIKKLKKDFFKYNSSIKVPGVNMQKDNLFFYRVNLLDKLSEQPGLGVVKNVTQDELRLNVAFIAKLVSSYVHYLDDEEMDRINFTSERMFVPNSTDRVDPVEVLLCKSLQLPRLRDPEVLDSLLVDYDFQYDGGSFFINTLGNGPLFVRNIGEVQVFYRNMFNDLDDILIKIVSYSLPYILYSEGYQLSASKSLKYKQHILERFMGISINDLAPNLRYIIEDAYSDLIRISNLGQMSNMDLRIERLAKLRNPFKDNLLVSINRHYYRPLFTPYEFSQYSTLFNVLRQGLVNFIPVIKGKVKNDEEYAKSYYIYDQLPSECNKLKINEKAMNKQIINFYMFNKKLSGIINDIHLDVRLGLYNLMLHLDFVNAGSLYYKGSDLCEVVNIMTNQYYQKKPVLIKMLIKNILDAIYHDYKEDGLLSFHQLETLFGFRNSHLILDEVKDDYLSWFNEGYEKYSDIQSDFIHKWADEFFNSKNFTGERIRDIMAKNLKYYKDFSDILGSPKVYMTSKGSVDDFKVMTKRGKTRNITKNMYFNVFEDQESYEANLGKRAPRRNKVIIKREEYVKQRIVINSTLDTFVPLSKINKFASVLTSGTGITYFSNTKQQKAEHYNRFQNYLLYNKYIENKYLAMPLDYSSYDHTITMGFIRATVEELGKVSGYYQDVEPLLNQFLTLLSKERIYFEELGNSPDNNQMYKYGMLSGWKITSSIESIGNAIITYGVNRELNENLVDFETMGDDLIIIIDKQGLDRPNQLRTLEKFCEKYSTLGFKMNAPKNSVGYYFLEFLRVTFTPGLVQSYPARILGSLTTVKPGRTDATFGINEFQSVVRKVSKRYGITSQFLRIADFISKYYLRSDIRKFGVRYLVDPYGFEIERIDKVDFEIDYKKSPESTPIFKKYMKITSGQFKDDIIDIVNNNYLRRVVAEFHLKPIKGKRVKPSDWQIKLIAGIFKFIKLENPSRNLDFKSSLHFPDYYLSQLLVEKIKKFSFKEGVNLLLLINYNMRKIAIITEKDYLKNRNLILLCQDKLDLTDILGVDKLKAREGVIPAMIISRAKRILVKWIKRCMLQYNFNDQERSFLKSIVYGHVDPLVHATLGIVLDEIGSTVNVSSGMPIAYRSD